MSKPVMHVKFFTSSFHMHKNMNFEIIKLPSDMGTESIIVNGFSFTKNYIYKSTDISWRCISRRTNCPAIIRTDADCTVIGGTFTHTHEPYSQRSIDRKIIKNAVKRKAEGDVTVRPSKLETKRLLFEFDIRVSLLPLDYITQLKSSLSHRLGSSAV